MLTIEDLKVEVEGKVVLEHIDLEVPDDTTHILFGPNGSGKTSLLMTIMGFQNYVVRQGRILFQGEDITKLPLHERAKRGIGMSFQRPPSIDGLKLKDLLSLLGVDEKDVREYAADIRFEHFLERDVNVGFSGGEIKRSELLQLMAQQPDLLLFDEPESGVDLESIALIGETINCLIKGYSLDGKKYCLKKEKETRKRSGLIITHTGHILDYVDADQANVLFNGRIACQGNPRELLRGISDHGYEECTKCLNG
jgi:Fe-S cluster assembly ATP-binding protein